MASKEIQRDDLLILLSSMGIVLPDTKLSVDELNKKFGQALDVSQQLSTHLPITPADPNSFSPWNFKKKGGGTDTESKTLYQATQRRNVSEIYGGVTEQPKQGSRASKQDTFKEMRQSIMGIAYAFDRGMHDICYFDENKKCILLTILDVRKVNEDIPLFLFEYKELDLNPGDQFPSNVTVPILDLERRALLKLFQRNTRKLDESYAKPKRDMTRSLLYKSFVLPLCPLNMQMLGKLTLDAGCHVCGEKNTSRCLQCLSVAYCSKECQKKDWPHHKSACRSLKGGTWSTIKLSNFPAGSHLTLFNRLDPLSTSFGTPSHVKGGISIPPDEANKGKIFLAKFQTAETHMLIYDRQRSFQLLWFRNSNPILFDRAKQMMGEQYKFYRWVKRVGDQMEVCLDRSPATNPVW